MLILKKLNKISGFNNGKVVENIFDFYYDK